MRHRSVIAQPVWLLQAASSIQELPVTSGSVSAWMQELKRSLEASRELLEASQKASQAAQEAIAEHEGRNGQLKTAFEARGAEVTALEVRTEQLKAEAQAAKSEACRCCVHPKSSCLQWASKRSSSPRYKAVRPLYCRHNHNRLLLPNIDCYES